MIGSFRFVNELALDCLCYLCYDFLSSSPILQSSSLPPSYCVFLSNVSTHFPSAKSELVCAFKGNSFPSVSLLLPLHHLLHHSSALMESITVSASKYSWLRLCLVLLRIFHQTLSHWRFPQIEHSQRRFQSR